MYVPRPGTLAISRNRKTNEEGGTRVQRTIMYLLRKSGVNRLGGMGMESHSGTYFFRLLNTG